MRPLDRTDAEILRHLQNNARLSNKELAAKIGLAPSSCLARVRRLIEDGAFRGFHAQVEPSAVGVGVQAIIAVRLKHHVRNQVDSFHDYVAGLEEVIAVYHLTGPWDYLVHVAVADLPHLRELALSAFTTRGEVEHIETSVVFEHLAKPVLPIYGVEDEPDVRMPPRMPPGRG